MPVSEQVTITVTCDNPACPGNNLDASDRTGWTFVMSEVYGQSGQQNVYCCAMCAGTISEVLAADEEPEAE